MGGGRQRPTPGTIPAQAEDGNVLGPGPLGRYPTPILPGAITCEVFMKSKGLKISPSLLKAWSPCSLLYIEICWGFSKALSHWLYLTSLPGWDVMLVTGLLKMQLVSLIRDAALSWCLFLALAKWTSLFFSAVWGIMFLLSLPFKNKKKCDIWIKWGMRTTRHKECSRLVWVFHPPLSMQKCVLNRNVHHNPPERC